MRVCMYVCMHACMLNTVAMYNYILSTRLDPLHPDIMWPGWSRWPDLISILHYRLHYFQRMHRFCSSCKWYLCICRVTITIVLHLPDTLQVFVLLECFGIVAMCSGWRSNEYQITTFKVFQQSLKFKWIKFIPTSYYFATDSYLLVIDITCNIL